MGTKKEISFSSQLNLWSLLVNQIKKVQQRVVTNVKLLGKSVEEL